MAPRTSLVSSISDYVNATGATLAGRQAMARWSVTRPALRSFPTLSHVVRAARDGSPAEQDRLLGELLAVAGDEPLAQLAIVAALSRKLSAAVAAWRRGGASVQDLAELEADLVSAAWAEVVSCAAVVNAGREAPARLGLVLVDRGRQSVRVSRRRELRSAARRVSTEGLPDLTAQEDRPTAELLATEIAGAVRAGRISAAAAGPVFLTRVVGFSTADAAGRLGCSSAVLRALRSRAERRLVA